MDRYNNNNLRRDFVGRYGSTNTQKVNAVFRESVPQVLEKIKNEPFFKWPNKMVMRMQVIIFFSLNVYSFIFIWCLNELIILIF